MSYVFKLRKYLGSFLRNFLFCRLKNKVCAFVLKLYTFLEFGASVLWGLERENLRFAICEFRKKLRMSNII